MYEELVKDLNMLRDLHENCDRYVCTECPDMKLCESFSNTKLYEIHKRAADAIEKLVSNADKFKWISVEDALPKKGTVVLGAVYCTDLIFAKNGETMEEAVTRCQAEAVEHPRVEMCFCDEDGWYSYDGFPMVCSPRYWIYLPEPPKEET